jgi:hypothetical protein
MTSRSMCLRTLLTLVVVLTGVSISQAGPFGRWRARYDYYPVCPTATYATPAGPSVSAAGQPAMAPTGPIPYTAAKPVIGENAGNVVAPAPQVQYYAPAVTPGYSGSGWSTIPRSTWDFGKFPPYSH